MGLVPEELSALPRPASRWVPSGFRQTSPPCTTTCLPALRGRGLFMPPQGRRVPRGTPVGISHDVPCHISTLSSEDPKKRCESGGFLTCAPKRTATSGNILSHPRCKTVTSEPPQMPGDLLPCPPSLGSKGRVLTGGVGGVGTRGRGQDGGLGRLAQTPVGVTVRSLGWGDPQRLPPSYPQPLPRVGAQREVCGQLGS